MELDEPTLKSIFGKCVKSGRDQKPKFRIHKNLKRRAIGVLYPVYCIIFCAFFLSKQMIVKDMIKLDHYLIVAPVIEIKQLKNL